MENANPSSSIANYEFLDPKKKLEIESWLEDEDITSIIDHHLGEVAFGKPFVRKTGLVYDQNEGTIIFEKDDEKITFKMPHMMETFNHVDLKDVNTDSIPPFVLENNDDRGKTYYSDSLALGSEYREDESISKEIRHLMKLERKAKKRKREVTFYADISIGIKLWNQVQVIFDEKKLGSS
ncbi:hypothetical protein Tco_1206292 [Tanacetum coccineum]